MQILKLALENTKRYESAQFDFTLGTNAIVGANGAGKSTILEAIGFALFDSLKYRASDFVREGAKSATVTVTILSGLDERRYEITRRCGSSNQYFAFDPEVQAKVCEGKTDVISFLKEHMQVDPSADLSAIFEDAVGVPQGTLTAAFLQTPAIRKKAFDTLLQVEEYKEAADKLREPVRKVKDQIQEMDLSLTEVATRLERLPQLEAQVSERSKSIAKLRQEVEGHQKELDAAVAIVEEQSQIQQQLTKAEELQRTHAQKEQSLHREIETAQQSVAESETCGQIVVANQPGFDKYEAAQKQQAQLNQQQSQRQQIESQRNQLVQSLSQLTADEGNAKQNLREAGEAAELVKSLTAAVAEQDKLDEVNQQTMRRRLQIEEAQRSAPQLQQRLEQLQTRAEQLTKQLSSRDTMIAERQQAEAALNQQQNAIREISHAMGQYQSEAEALKAQTESLEDRGSANCPVCEEPLSEAHRTRLIDRNTAKLAELREAYRMRRSEEDGSKAQIDSLQKQLTQLDVQVRTLPRPEELAAAQAELTAHQAAVQESAQGAGELAAVVTELAQIQANLDKLENPRQRSAIAQQVAGKEPQLSEHLARLTEDRISVDEQMKQIAKQLDAFATVDEALGAAMILLETHSEAYQAVLANTQTASLLAERQQRVAELAGEQKSLAAVQGDTAQEVEQLTARFDEDALLAAQGMTQELRTTLATITAQKRMLDESQHQDQAEIGQLQKLKDEQVGTLAKRERLSTQCDALEMIRTYLRQAGPYITSTLIQQVSSGAGEIFSDLMQDYSRHLNWNEDYGIILEVEGRDRHFAQLSGGEQMSAALSVRLALLREMSNIDIAFFDEPTTNLDEPRRESLARQILAVKGFQQLFVISHDDTFEQSTENVIRIES